VVLWELISCFPAKFIKSSGVSVAETVCLSFLLNASIVFVLFGFV